jgi:predicted unusual protein kinase regulating ubiquinone biosynthesis (AarF/ABC1/UbiB family)
MNYLTQSYNIFKTIYLVIKIINILKENKEVDNDLTNNLKDSIQNVGIFGIKLVQWSILKLKLLTENHNTINFLDKLKCFYEDCKSHSYELTKEIYYNDFNKNLEDDYEINTIPEASGSIGQVYSAIDKKTNKKVAIKCVHPDIFKEITMPKFILKNFNDYVTKLYYFNKFKIPININDFFCNLEDQMNMLNEAKNMKRMKELFKSNEYLIIPEIYSVSNNILIMSYEEGVSWSKFNGSRYKKSKISTLLKLYTLSSLQIQGFCHGDLHLGNWKIQNTSINKLNKIVLLDFGLCYECSNKLVNNLIDAINNKNINDVIDIILSKEAIYYNPKSKIYTNTLKKNIIRKFKELLSKNTKDTHTIDLKDIQKLLPLVTEHGLIFNTVFINMLLSFSILKNYTDKYTENSLYYKNKNISNESKFTITYPSLIAYCETYNIFPELKELFKKQINNYYIKFNKEAKLFNDTDLRISELSSM